MVCDKTMIAIAHPHIKISLPLIHLALFWLAHPAESML